MCYRAVSEPIGREPECRFGRFGIARQRGAGRARGGVGPLPERGPSGIGATSGGVTLIGPVGKPINTKPIVTKPVGGTTVGSPTGGTTTPPKPTSGTTGTGTTSPPKSTGCYPKGWGGWNYKCYSAKYGCQ